MAYYGIYSPAFLLHFVAVIAVNYLFAVQIQRTRSKTLVGMAVAANILHLAFFKYFNSVFALVAPQGAALPEWFKIVMPLAISFYTFQFIAFLVDVYRSNAADAPPGAAIKPEPGRYFLFMLFFPHLISGPILRAADFYRQIGQEVALRDMQVRGLYLVALGLIKKLFIADVLGYLVNPVYKNPSEYGSADALAAILGYTAQLYCDFSGYSDIAIGAAKIMGIDVMENFKRPLFAKNLADIWTRWHISLSTWLTDYVFFYLGAYKASSKRVIFNVIFVLAVCGLWHGANWPMVLAFTMVGVFMAIRYWWQANVLRVIKPSNSYKLFEKFFPSWMHSVVTVAIFVFCFLLFRVHTAQMVINFTHPTEKVSWVAMAKAIYGNLFKLHTAGYFYGWMTHQGIVQFIIVLFFMTVLILTEAIIGDVKIETVALAKTKTTRWTIYILLLVCIVWFGIFNNTSFVYFQY